MLSNLLDLDYVIKWVDYILDIWVVINLVLWLKVKLD